MRLNSDSIQNGKPIPANFAFMEAGDPIKPRRQCHAAPGLDRGPRQRALVRHRRHRYRRALQAGAT